jgi:hypothetical protein
MSENAKRIAKRITPPEDLAFNPDRSVEEFMDAPEYRCLHVGPRGKRGVDYFWANFLIAEGHHAVFMACDGCTKQLRDAPKPEGAPELAIVARRAYSAVSVEEVKELIRAGYGEDSGSELGRKVTQEVMDEAKKGGVN